MKSCTLAPVNELEPVGARHAVPASLRAHLCTGTACRAPTKSFESGYALVMVLWLTTILTFIAGLAYASARTEVQLTSGNLTLLKGEALAEAGLWLAIDNAVNTAGVSFDEFINFNTTVHFDDRPITVGMNDIAGKINLNHAPRELLALLLASTSLSSAEATTLSYHIADWKDADSESAVSIDEQTPYREHGLDYGPRNRPFSTLDELRLVAGMTDPVYRDIAPFLTLYGSHTHLNEPAADPALIDRLARANPNDESWRYRFLSASAGNIFTITSSVEMDGSIVRMTAVAELLPQGKREAVRILDWGI